MESYLAAYLAASAEAARGLADDRDARKLLAGMAASIAQSQREGGKLLIAGNGASAADAQHIAAEYVSRLAFDRPPLAALALTESGPILTACGNDYGFQTIFARQITALGRPGDVLLALSTSGNSPNLFRAAEAARAIGMTTLGFTGPAGGAMADKFTTVFRARSENPQIVQQLHMAAAHAVLASIERALFAPEHTD